MRAADDRRGSSTRPLRRRHNATSGPGRRPFAHLLEVGVSWPPETFLQRTFESLAARGMRVVVATRDRPHDATTRLSGVEVELVPAAGERRLKALLGLGRSGLRLALTRPRRLIALLGRVSVPPRFRSRRSRLWKRIDLLRSYVPLAQLNPDIVHFEWESAATHNLPLFGVWGCPIVMSCHGSGLHVDPHTPAGSRRLSDLRIAFREAVAVRCVSEAMRDEAIRYGLEPGKTWLVRPAVDTSFFRPPASRTASPMLRVVTVGKLRWVKGHDFAVEAIRRLAEGGISVELDLVGDGPDRERVRYAIQDLALDDRVHLRGMATPFEVRRWLQRADVLLQSSVSEGLPTVVLEAMACGLPVVATDCGGVREAVSHGIHGLVVPPRDTRSMAVALRRLSSDPDLRERMGRAGRERVESEFQLWRQTDELLTMYGHVTARFEGSAA